MVIPTLIISSSSSKVMRCTGIAYTDEALKAIFDEVNYLHKDA